MIAERKVGASVATAAKIAPLGDLAIDHVDHRLARTEVGFLQRQIGDDKTGHTGLCRVSRESVEAVRHDRVQIAHQEHGRSRSDSICHRIQDPRKGGPILEGRAAVVVGPPDAGEPVFGAVWIKARILTDLDSRMVTFEDIRVPQVRFPELPEEKEEKLIALLTSAMPTWPTNIRTS